MSLLGLRVVHYAGDWVMLTFNGNDKLLTRLIMYVNSEDLKEVIQNFALSEGIRLDGPSVRVKQQVFRSHLLEQLVREVLEEAPLRILDIVDFFDLWPRLSVNFNSAQRILILIGQLMN